MKALNHTSEAVTLRYIGIEQEQLDNTYLNLKFKKDMFPYLSFF